MSTEATILIFIAVFTLGCFAVLCAIGGMLSGWIRMWRERNE